MRRLSLALALAATAAFFMAATASADIGWYAKWGGGGPVTVTVQGVSALPADEQTLFRAAMDSWSASPAVDFAETGNGRVKVVVDTTCEVACTTPRVSGSGRLNGATMHFNPAIFQWTDEQWVFCHELGHTIGLGEGYPVDVTGDYGSCMAADGVLPSQMDMDVLAAMYPPGGTKGH